MRMARKKIVDGMVREKVTIEYPVGSDLSPSRKTPGAHAPLVHTDKGIGSQVVVHRGKPRELSPTGKAAVDLLVDVGVSLLIMGANEFIERGVPAIKNRIAERRARRISASVAQQPESDENDSSAIEEQRIDSDVAEQAEEIDVRDWYQLLFDAIAHGAAARTHEHISIERWNKLAGSRVLGDPEAQALASAMRELTPEEFRERVDRVLEAHPELANEEPESIITKLFDGASGREPIPIPNVSDDETGAMRTLETPLPDDAEDAEQDN